MARPDPDGLFDARYRTFLETVTHLRGDLHRYCARMTGSVLDGEDVMQEALFEAYRKIEKLDDLAALRPWLFRLAHNRCIDHLRRRQARQRAEAGYAQEDVVHPSEAAGAGTRNAIERLVIALPPKERACVLLKDVFDYSLEEVAGLVGSTVGGVKAALHRGRTRLASLPPTLATAAAPPDPMLSTLLHRYVELFNRRDWNGVRALTTADATLRVADCFKGRLADSPYFVEYETARAEWRMEVGELDGEPVAIVFVRGADVWEWAWPVRIRATAGIVHHLADYHACPWLAADARREPSSIAVRR
jgi:RNA polymerase sigma-70 factor (ECF subfamily)